MYARQAEAHTQARGGHRVLYLTLPPFLWGLSPKLELNCLSAFHSHPPVSTPNSAGVLGLKPGSLCLSAFHCDLPVSTPKSAGVINTWNHVEHLNGC